MQRAILTGKLGQMSLPTEPNNTANSGRRKSRRVVDLRGVSCHEVFLSGCGIWRLCRSSVRRSRGELSLHSGVASPTNVLALL